MRKGWKYVITALCVTALIWSNGAVTAYILMSDRPAGTKALTIMLLTFTALIASVGLAGWCEREAD